ncbi:MAG: prepilin-type N-terminal cleavage/methylation domain-containing protein [Sedimentisphaerales bacterium]|nr:prepilin-type N-terminal cleavage/methylation domain-containing protein [Sedimentisphaerales bacterium]
MDVRKRAFTLIELLVVIAIIGILLAIMTPALRKAKEQMWYLKCKSGLKSYGMAMKLYTADNEDKYPECSWSVYDGRSSGIPVSCQWHDRRISPDLNPEYAGPVWSYLETQETSMCPTFKKFAMVYGPDHPGHDSSIPIEPQYAYSQNVFLGRMKSNGQPLAVLRESEVVDPANVLVWVEETIWLVPPESVNRWVLNDTCFFTRHPQDSTGLGDHIATYHFTPVERKNEGLGNAVFVDGHADVVDPYNKMETTWGEISGNFRLAWPLRNKFSATKPYTE